MCIRKIHALKSWCFIYGWFPKAGNGPLWPLTAFLEYTGKHYNLLILASSCPLWSFKMAVKGILANLSKITVPSFHYLLAFVQLSMYGLSFLYWPFLLKLLEFTWWGISKNFSFDHCQSLCSTSWLEENNSMVLFPWQKHKVKNPQRSRYIDKI